jgi:hypothetical protein
MIFQTTITIRATKQGNRVIHHLWFTFSKELVSSLGWQCSDTLTCQLYSRAIKLQPSPKGIKLGRYARPGSLWLRYRITNKIRKQFLKTYSNGFSAKVQWTARGMFALNSKLILSGKGSPIGRQKRK